MNTIECAYQTIVIDQLFYCLYRARVHVVPHVLFAPVSTRVGAVDVSEYIFEFRNVIQTALYHRFGSPIDMFEYNRRIVFDILCLPITRLFTINKNPRRYISWPQSRYFSLKRLSYIVYLLSPITFFTVLQIKLKIKLTKNVLKNVCTNTPL